MMSLSKLMKELHMVVKDSLGFSHNKKKNIFFSTNLNKKSPIPRNEIEKVRASVSFMVRKAIGKRNVLATYRTKKVYLIHF